LAQQGTCGADASGEGICICNPGYTGADCSSRACKYGIDPLYIDDESTARVASSRWNSTARAAFAARDRPVTPRAIRRLDETNAAGRSASARAPCARRRGRATETRGEACRRHG